jgi:hypothetical protein
MQHFVGQQGEGDCERREREDGRRGSGRRVVATPAPCSQMIGGFKIKSCIHEGGDIMYDANAYLHAWICRFKQRIAMLEFKQSELEAENQRLKDQLFGPVLNDMSDQLQARLKNHLDNQLKEKLDRHLDDLKHATPPNITYKIQELHVNELKGTLNIGLTSTATPEQLHSMIEKLKTDQGNIAENMFFSQDTEEPRKSDS